MNDTHYYFSNKVGNYFEEKGEWESKDGFGEDNLYEFEEPEEEIIKFISTYLISLINIVIPEKPRELTLKTAEKCLRVLGKIWNLSEYPPINYIHDIMCPNAEERLMDMEGYVDDYQYLHIEAVDLALTDIKVIPKHFIWLLSVDLSGNCLTNITACPVTKLPNIVTLRLNRNLFEDPYLDPMKHLQYLSLNSNKLSSLHRIYHPNLETLDLNYNLIKNVNAEDCLKHTKLRQLELRGNELTTTSGIEYFSLVNLYLAQNQITQLRGLENLVNLERLHLRQNPLSDLRGFSKSNMKLKYLNIRQCNIANVQEIKNLEMLIGLKELVVKGNIFNPEPQKMIKEEEEDEEEPEKPEEESEDEENIENNHIRMKILSYLPTLIRIDKQLVSKEELQSMREILEDVGSY